MDIPLHDKTACRFVLQTGQEHAFIEYRLLDNNSLDVCHTFVPPALRGKGLAAILMKAVCEHARAQGLKIVPSCSYADTYLKKNLQEYGSLIDQSNPCSPSCRLP